MKIRRPSHATVVAYLALLTALGGSAYAASKVGTSDLKANAVTSPKIDRGAVRAADVKRLVVRQQAQPVSAGARGTAIANCREHEQVVSGGGSWGVLGSGNTPAIVGSSPAGQGWSVDGEPPPVDNTLIAYAICLPR
jgi:hypothetical protein